MSVSIDKVVAITGASSGIGAAAAVQLAKAGARVVLGARRVDRLQETVNTIRSSGGQATCCALDVTSLPSMQAFAALAHDTFGRLDVMVNNAGIMPLSPLSALRVTEWDEAIDVNVRGVLHGIAAALPYMERQQGGHIVNVSSVAGHTVRPTAAVYAATKFAVRAISEGLRRETANVRVTIISPGATQTELRNSILDPAVREAVDKSGAAYISAESIAEAMVYAISQPAHVDVSELIVRSVGDVG